jgi:putative FmdB family regulatory protein
MPVYEFYCPDCHVIYSFFSRRPNTRARPDCPVCARPELERRVSLFAISKGRGDRDADADLPEGVDEEAMMKAMASMAGELEHLDEDDPKQAARVMRRLFEGAGLKVGDAMAEMMGRMEAGEDPEQLEAEYADVLEAEDPLMGGGLRRLRRKLLAPRRDEKWYPLE